MSAQLALFLTPRSGQTKVKTGGDPSKPPGQLDIRKPWYWI